MKYFLSDNWMVTVKFAIRPTAECIVGMENKLAVLTVSFYTSVDTSYLEMRQIAWKILKERMKVDKSQYDELFISELTLALSGD